MHWKKYLILLIPATVLFLCVLYVFPEKYRAYSMSIPLIFWLFYYVWKGIDESKEKDDSK